VTLKRIGSGSKFEELAAYCRAVVDDHYIHFSGTVGADPRTHIMPDSVSAQMANIFAIIEPILTGQGAGLADVVRCRLYLTDQAHLEPAIAVLREKFHACRPANTTLICAIPAPGAKVELEITARRPFQAG
jgi:enamine deaminase RidA (YjgF/YER057c/UK114 family)